MTDDKCVVCDQTLPEGRMVCPICEKSAISSNETAEFRIPYPGDKKQKTAWNRRFGLNAYYSGKHWGQRQTDAQLWHTLTVKALQKYNVPKFPVDSQVILTFYFNDGLDCSNHAAEVKMIEDALKGRVISDDSRRYVVGNEIYFHDKEYILVQVRRVNNGAD